MRMEFKVVATQDLFKEEAQGKFQLNVHGRTASPEGLVVRQLYGPEPPELNGSRFRNAQFDRALERFLRAPDEAERLAASRTMTEVMQVYAPLIPLMVDIENAFSQPWVHGLLPLAVRRLLQVPGSRSGATAVAARRRVRDPGQRRVQCCFSSKNSTMRVSRFYLSTLKEAPAEADVISQQLMLRAGLIKKLGSGLYTWMPLGLITLRKVEQIIREEMNRAGALELVMPVIQPAELWQETGRWELMGPNMLRLKDRHERDFIVGPTHEEVITDIVRREIRSYRQLPVNFYQIQTKFRDEIRPRFGVMRAREFIMKDAYSFDVDEAGMLRSYQIMYDAYARIFTRMGLEFRAVDADNGAIGGKASHEFQVLAESGEDAIAYSNGSDVRRQRREGGSGGPGHAPRERPRSRWRRCPRRASPRAKKWPNCWACRSRARSSA